MKEQDLFYLLALQRIEGVGDIMQKLLTHCGSASGLLQRLQR
jgi:DNA processing protein